MKADLNQQMAVPPQIISTRRRPDMLLWSDLDLVGSLVASMLVRYVLAGASVYVFFLDFGTRDYNI